jgi:hypothetical protein
MEQVFAPRCEWLDEKSTAHVWRERNRAASPIRVRPIIEIEARVRAPSRKAREYFTRIDAKASRLIADRVSGVQCNSQAISYCFILR